MASYRSFTPDEALRAAANALTGSSGATVALELIANLGDEDRRNLVLRARARSSAGETGSVIVKATRAATFDAAAANAFETFGFAREWTAATLLGSRDRERAKTVRLRAADAGAGVLVFDDLGADVRLLVAPLLRGTADDAERALIAHAEALGRLHVATLDCQTEYTTVARTAFANAAVQPAGRRWLDSTAQKMSNLLGGDLPTEELDVIGRRLQAPGGWLSLVHRDPCPDNVVLSPDGGATLIDFEFAAPGHALLDAVYWRMGFPTCWCAGRTPIAVGQRIDRAYRDVVGDRIPEAADDDVFLTEASIIAAAWLFDCLSWRLEDAMEKDVAWGLSSYRARILHYLATAHRAMEEADTLPRTRGVVFHWLDDLTARWPEILPLEVYPAFAGTDDA